jgi:N-formylglutamate amidohydrolase
VPDIVLGDCHGYSAGAALVRQAERAFAMQGFSVARNAPYAGGYTTQHYSRRDAGIETLQIEVNRALYLDEAAVEKHAGFAAVKGRIAAALRQLVAAGLGLAQPPLAAE